MRVSFHLRKDKVSKKGSCPVRMLISVNGVSVFKVIKGLSVYPSHWDEKQERVKKNKKNEEYNFYIEYNKKIDYYYFKIQDFFRYVMLNEIPVSKDYIKEQLAKDFKEISVKNDFFSTFEDFIEASKNTKSKNTLKTYTTVFKYLKAYEEYIGTQLSFASIDLKFFEEIRDYSYGHKNIATNYFSKIIGILKTFMKWSLDREIHSNSVFTKFKAKEHEIEVIYLTMDELLMLDNFEFEIDKLDRVRDVFIFGASTGLRYSDLKELKTSNIFEDHINLTIKKTKSLQKIPLNKFSSKVLDKYKDTIFEPIPQISDVNFNKYIKECCKIVGINSGITISRYFGQNRIDVTKPKYELVTSHVMRKTFVTNSLVLGMKEMVIRNITGHKKESSFRRYVKVAEDVKKVEMQNTWDKI